MPPAVKKGLAMPNPGSDASTAENSKAESVLFALNSLAGGGAERSTILTVANWPSSDLRPELLLGSLEGPYAKELPEQLPITIVGELRRVKVFAYLSLLRKAIRKTGAVAIVATGAQAKVLLVGRALRLLPPIAIILVQRNDYESKLRSRCKTTIGLFLARRTTRPIFRRADAIVGISQGVSTGMETALKVPRGSVTTILNPVDRLVIAKAIEAGTEKTKNAGTTTCETLTRKMQLFEECARPRVITVGRLVQQKAHSDLLEAFALLPKADRGSLTILGEGPLRETLEKKGNDLGISDELWMPGFVDNPWWFMARSDLFVLSSHWEGFGRVLVEALACGLPVVSTDCPSGPREILEGVVKARLCPVGDVDAMASGILALIHSGRATSPQDFSRFEPHSVAKDYEALVREVLKRRQLVDGDDL